MNPTDGLTLTETLSITEKLQKAEARALAAEMALTRIRYLDSQLAFAGKMGILLSSELDELLNPTDLTAAREALRKAEEWDEVAENLRAALHESEAMLLKVKTALLRWHAGGSNDSVLCEIERGLHTPPTTALADLKARIRREVLEEAAKSFEDGLCELWSADDAAAELRRMAEEGK